MEHRLDLFRQFTYGLFLFAAFGMFLSRVVLSVSFIGLFGISILWIVLNKFKFDKNAFLGFAALSVTFFIILFSGIKGGDSQFWFKHLVLKLPFFSMSLALFALPSLEEKQFNRILLVFGSLAVATGIYTLGNYLINMESIHEEMLKGRGFPNPVNQHIRYSLMLVMGLCCWSVLMIRGFFEKKTTKVIAWLCIVFLVVLIHVISVRSGWLALYLVGLYFLIRYLLVRKNWALGAVFAIALIGGPFLAYYSIESVENKVRYTLYDLQQAESGNITGLSDARRMTSIRVGLELGRSDMLTGVGVGSLREETNSYYQEHYPELTESYEWQLPHNEFVWFFAATGLIGLVFFCISFFLPLFHRAAFKESMILCTYLVIGSSLLTEATFDRQLGVALFLVFITLALNVRKAIRTDHNL